MKYRTLLLLAALALPAAAQEAAPAPEDWEAQRTQAREMRTRADGIRGEAERTFQAADAACWEKVLVASCREDALKAKRSSEREARRIDIEAGRIERRVAAHDREARQEKRRAEEPQRQAKIERRREEIRRHEEEALQRQANKEAEIERRRKKNAQ